MISAVDIQNAYIKLYEQLRKYIWAGDVVEKIADLETCVYEVFPNMDDVRKTFKYLKPELYQVIIDDEEFKAAVDKFEEAIKDEVGYGRLEKVQEVI